MYLLLEYIIYKQKRYMNSYIYCSSISNSQDMKIIQVSRQGLEKMWYIFIMDYYSATVKKKKWKHAVAKTQMDL